MQNSGSREQTLLIVDDEPSNIQILMELLSFDHKILVANNGEKALKIAAGDKRPDLILLDVVMPGMDGYEVCRQLKQNEATRDIPVIFITARGAEDDEAKGFELGAVDYIAKPFSNVVVKARLRTQLGLKQKTEFFEWMLKERTQELQNMEREYARLFRR